jgi:hypothetical protein
MLKTCGFLGKTLKKSIVIFNSINISYVQRLWRFEKKNIKILKFPHETLLQLGGILASNSMSNQTFGFRVCVWTAFHFPKRRIHIKGFLIILIVWIPGTTKIVRLSVKGNAEIITDIFKSINHCKVSCPRKDIYNPQQNDGSSRDDARFPRVGTSH